MPSDYEIVFYPVARTENEGALWPGCRVCILISVPVASHINLPGRSPSQYRPNSMCAPLSQLPPPLSTCLHAAGLRTVRDFMSCLYIGKTSPGDSVGTTRWVTGIRLPKRAEVCYFTAASRPALSPSVLSGGYRGVSARFHFCGFVLDDCHWIPLLLLKRIDRGAKSRLC
jgi:hypothetical protein